MRRLFWLGVGAAAGSYLTRRAGRAAHSASPAGVGANIADGLRELGAGLGAFGAEVRAGMNARERELTELVERRTGSTLPSVSDALTEPEQVDARSAAAARGIDGRSAAAPRGARATRDGRARRAGV